MCMSTAISRGIEGAASAVPISMTPLSSSLKIGLITDYRSFVNSEHEPHRLDGQSTKITTEVGAARGAGGAA